MPFGERANRYDPNDEVYRSSKDMEWNPATKEWGTIIGGLGVPSGEMTMRELGYGDVGNYAGYESLSPLLRAGAARTRAVNPYSNVVADQNRGAQLALLQQMRAQQAGPSVANMQSQRAMGQNIQGALGAGAGRGAMMQARNVGAGLAGDTGQAALAEQMRMMNAATGGANSLRAGDIGTANQASQFGISAQQQADTRARAYTALGRQLDESRARQALENMKAARSYDKLKQQQVMKAVSMPLGAISGAL